jgi:molybdate transport system substrate-binding protein
VKAALILVKLLILAPPLPADEVLVFAAASLTDALKEVGKGFETASGHHVLFAFGGSGDLARQIRAGAPADIFFSADLQRMDELEAAGLVRAQERVNVLSNALVVVVPASAPNKLQGPADLLQLEHVALADPETVPAGLYARAYFESIGLWPALAGRVIPTLDVRAALAAVESGHAPAAVVYRTDATTARGVRVALEVPREQGPAIVYPLAPLASSPKSATRDLVRYLLSPAARTVYERLGFVVIARQ